MSERDRLQRQIRSLESIEQGLHSNISDYQQRIISAQRDRADAGRHTDALERQRAADRRIETWNPRSSRRSARSTASATRSRGSSRRSPRGGR